MPDLLPPVKFREEILEPVIELLRAGESCGLVGVSSVGKTVLARHLTRADVRLHYFGPQAARVFILYLNCKPLAQQPPHALHTLALEQLIHAAEELAGAFTPLLPALKDLLLGAQRSPEALAKRNLARAIERVVQAGAELIVNVLDECDELLAKAPATLFTDLCELHDIYTRRIIYVTLTRREPMLLRRDLPEARRFMELIAVADHLLSVTPYLEADAFFMIQRLSARQETSPLLSYSEKRRLYELSGGHPGLIRAIFQAVRRNPPALEIVTAKQLTANAEVDDECSKIMKSVEEIEQADLGRIAARSTPTDDGLRRLKRRELVRVLSVGPQIFSPVFESYLRLKFGVTGAITPLEFFDATHYVRIQDQLITSLTWPEYIVLRHLYSRRPQVCRAADLMEAVRPAEMGRPEERAQGSSAERLSQYILHIKAKIGPAGQHIHREPDGYRFSQ
jgi:hypothetical protein